MKKRSLPSAGNSSVQSEAEHEIRNLLQKTFENPLMPMVLSVGDGIRVAVDAGYADHSVMIEIFARQGKLLDGQKRKIAKDILKLALLRNKYPNARLILAFANPLINDYLSRGTWISLTVRQFNLEPKDVFADLSTASKARISEAQYRQGHNMRAKIKKE